MNNLSFASIKELRLKLARKEISAQELLDYCVQRFDQKDGDLVSALEIFDTDSIQKKGNGSGLLHGIPGLIKDTIAQENRALSCASKILQGFESTFDATAVSRLKEEGALLIGR